MFHPYEPVRTKLVQNLISRHLDECVARMEKADIHEFGSVVRSDVAVQFLLKDLGISPTVVFSELIEYARAHDEVELEIVCRLELKQFSEAFNLVLRYYIYPDVMENHLDSVKEELWLFRDHVESIESWTRIGSVLEQYVSLINGTVQMTCEETLSLLCSIEKMREDGGLLQGNDMIRMTQEMSYQVLRITIELLRSSDKKEELLEQVGIKINALGSCYMKKIQLQDTLEEIIMVFLFIC